MTDNPLLTFTDLPPFSAIRPEHAEPALRQVIDDNRRQIEAILARGGPYTWDNLVRPLEEMEDRLGKVWSPISHLNSVVNNEALRAAYKACLPLMSEYATEMGQNETLFRAYQSVAESPAFPRLEPAQQKIVRDALRDFRLSGVGLPQEKKDRYKAIMKRLSALTSQFSDNVLDATNAWKKHITDKRRLAGLPESALAMAKQTAELEGADGWMLTLEFPSYFAVITYADDRSLREEIYRAYVTRASDEGPHAGRWDNTPLMREMLALRHEMAQLLGFDNYAEYSLATKMAETPEQVMTFLRDLARRSLPIARRELDEVRRFAAEQLGLDDLESWDLSYASEKLRLHKYAITQEELKPYFPEPRVVAGMFKLVERLYGLRIRARADVDVWHPDVRFYEIFDAGGELRGQFYLDLYARPHKRGGAWMDECRGRKRLNGEVQIPVAYLTCNFSPPIGNDPALFTHDEVLTLFHEFGHGLHHMLTRVDYPSVAGISGVPWDAVELPSQFMENWCWRREVLDLFSGHFRTGETLPQPLFEKMIAAKNFQSGMQMVRQLEFSLFDFRIHAEYEPSEDFIDRILSEVRDEVAVFHPPSFNRFAHSFAHVFSGGYAAGYYSYKWAEVLSADAFAEFEERGIFDGETGRRFLATILEQGGSREPMELFIEFRGREPTIDALLRHSGILG